MSRSELQRLQSDLRTGPGLAAELESLAGDPDAQVRWANEHGYRFSREEAADLKPGGELSDEELEVAAGGWTGDPNPDPTGSGGTGGTPDGTSTP
jgi:predicted ribosomally synthesized peptide with nif11-like leader